MNTRNFSTHTKKYKLILSAVHMVYRLVNSTYNVQELALRLTRLLCQFIKANSSIVYLLDPSKRKVILKAMFDNKINILVTKKDDLAKMSAEELRVINGYEIFEKHVIGLPLVADENVGAIFVRREKKEPAFDAFDKDMLSVIVEQSVTAIKNRQLYEEQQKIILGSIEFIGEMLSRYGQATQAAHMPLYFKIVKSLGERLSMSQVGIDCLYYASVLHDAGILDVPYEVLSKTDRLSPKEFNIIRSHPKKSVDLLKSIRFLKPILPIILYHHEKYDGSGYPSGLKKEQIPLGARIMSVVDAFEAMTVGRLYKNRLTIKHAIEELKKNSGTQFDPKVVLAFVRLSQQKKFRKYLSLRVK